MTVPFTLASIRNKVRRITGRTNNQQISDDQIDEYINTFYVFDLQEQLKLESFRVTYQFVTNANQAVYDFPKDLYLTAMPPVYIGGYECFMSQSREDFNRVTSSVSYLQQRVATGNGTPGPYNFTLTNRPLMHGWKRNPPGAYFIPAAGTIAIPASEVTWKVILSGLDANGKSVVLIDDGGASATGHSNTGHWFDPADANTDLLTARGTVNYTTGVVAATFAANIPIGTLINCQYIPYTASRPNSALFYQDQIRLFPIPDQAYTVSFEAYKYPTAFLQVAAIPVAPATTVQEPQLRELWQALAYGAACKIFEDTGDIDSVTKYRPFLEEQLKLLQRRTISQYSCERAATIYTQQLDISGSTFGNIFSGF